MVLATRTVPPQSWAPLSSRTAYFEKWCPYGLPCLLGEAHHWILLFPYRLPCLLEKRIKFICSVVATDVLPLPIKKILGGAPVGRLERRSRRREAILA
jgi:hypothetical protein